eukprot:10825570-Lingulodinium_polyedra.AAC.1
MESAIVRFVSRCGGETLLQPHHCAIYERCASAPRTRQKTGTRMERANALQASAATDSTRRGMNET